MSEYCSLIIIEQIISDYLKEMGKKKGCHISWIKDKWKNYEITYDLYLHWKTKFFGQSTNNMTDERNVKQVMDIYLKIVFLMFLLKS